MPSANHTVTVAFKVNNPVHIAVYQWLYDQADSPSELMRDAVIAIYGYRAIEQTDMRQEKKRMALLESLVELNKVAELNKAIASTIQSTELAPLNSPARSTTPAHLEPIAPNQAVEDGWDDDEECIMDID
jgi:hypothetical protein